MYVCLWPPGANWEKAPLETQPQRAGSLTQISMPLCKLGPKVPPSSQGHRPGSERSAWPEDSLIPQPYALCRAQAAQLSTVALPTSHPCLEKLPL